jgi:16S rRNA (adenine1518-N6/adenine1519-N6)-dimethyltransferase
MNAFRISPKKSLGQNFLRDPNYVRKIATFLSIQAEDAILEIGPGEGALTEVLVGRGRSLSVVDVDPRVTAGMHAMFGGGKVEIINEDFLQMDLVAFSANHPGKVRIVGNIPYNITTPILFHVLDHRRQVSDVTIMVQREVARRMAARPSGKEYGILSVLCGYWADVVLAFDVPPTAFYPRPRVTSTVVRLTMRDAPLVPVRDEDFFRAMVRAVFGKRRKTLRNSLRWFAEDRGLRIPAMSGMERRPEQLSIEELAELSDAILANNRGVPVPGAPTS